MLAAQLGAAGVAGPVTAFGPGEDLLGQPRMRGGERVDVAGEPGVGGRGDRVFELLGQLLPAGELAQSGGPPGGGAVGLDARVPAVRDLLGATRSASSSGRSTAAGSSSGSPGASSHTRPAIAAAGFRTCPRDRQDRRDRHVVAAPPPQRPTRHHDLRLRWQWVRLLNTPDHSAAPSRRGPTPMSIVRSVAARHLSGSSRIRPTPAGRS